MPQPLESLTHLKKLIAARGWFRDTRLVYQGFGPMAAHMFTHFLPVSHIVSEYYGEEVRKYIEGEWGTTIFSSEKMTGVRHNESGLFNRYFYHDHGDEFVITNGVPWEGLVLGHPRYGDYNVFLCYLHTRESIVEPGNWRIVNKRWREIADRVYAALGLVPCPPRLLPGEQAGAGRAT